MKKFLLASVFLVSTSASAQSLTPQSMNSGKISPRAVPHKLVPAESRAGFIPADVAANAPVDPEKMKLALELNKSFATRVNYEKTMESVTNQYIAGIKKNHPKESPAKLDEVRTGMTAITQKYKEPITEDNAKIFAQEFTTDELKQIITFNNSETGQKIGAKSGDVARNVISGQDMPNEGVSNAINELTLDDINNIKNFYASPLGQKMKNSMDRISGKLDAVKTKYMQSISNEVDTMAFGILGYHPE